jgi:hypothetical protein
MFAQSFGRGGLRCAEDLSECCFRRLEDAFRRPSIGGVEIRRF